jgi:spoIIIJ-associated protein
MNPSPDNTIEVSGDSVEQAITNGLNALNARPFEVIVEVLEDPSPAMFGREARPARVRLQRIVAALPPMPEPPRAPERGRETREPRPSEGARGERAPRRDRGGRGDGGRGGGGTGRSDRRHDGRGRAGDVREPRRDDQLEAGGFEKRERPPRAPKDDLPQFFEVDEDPSLPFNAQEGEVPEADFDDEVAIGKVVLNELLERMDVRARIVVKRAQADEQNASPPWILDVYGSMANRLIGRRGETLAALQYITRLITSRELQRRSDVIVDVEAYKTRRAQQLQTLATRMADEAIQAGRVMTLEPMPPHERRIIHLVLRGHPEVETRSIGEGDGRKVTIVPKASA